MIDGRSVLAIIPARGGSKRLPGKNVRTLGAVPLLAWTVDCARKTRHIDTIAVTTDDSAIANFGFSYGADAVIRRPSRLASDEATTVDATLHAMDILSPHDLIVLLQPTSPLRLPADIEWCINCAPAVSVCKNRVNGAVYVVNSTHLMEHKTFITPETVYYEMPVERSLDIDTMEDLERARKAVSVSVHSLMGA